LLRDMVVLPIERRNLSIRHTGRARPATSAMAKTIQLPAVIPLPPPLPYARDPGYYTELWTRQTRSTAGIEMEEQINSWLNQYSNVPTDYGILVSGITSTADWIGFPTVVKGNVILLVYSLGQFRTGLGTASPGNGRTFGLVGECVGMGPAPIIMVPSTGGLAAWVRPIELHEPSEAELETLKGSAERRTMDKPTIQGDATKDEDPNHPFLEVTNLCFIPKAWAAYFLDQCSPYEAYRDHWATRSLA
jgi:hypothetical protein